MKNSGKKKVCIILILLLLLAGAGGYLWLKIKPTKIAVVNFSGYKTAAMFDTVPGGFIQVYPNTKGEESKVNVEALFNTVHAHKELVKGIFSHE